MITTVKKKLYVGCAINGLQPELKQRFLAEIAQMKDQFRKHFEVLDFLGTAIGSPRDTYDQDITECVMKADCMLAICDHPSTGLGFEIAVALFQRKIPVLAMAHESSSVSRLILGIHGHQFEFENYDYFGDIPEQAKSSLTRMMSAPKHYPHRGLMLHN